MQVRVSVTEVESVGEPGQCCVPWLYYLPHKVSIKCVVDEVWYVYGSCIARDPNFGACGTFALRGLGLKNLLT